MPEIRVNQTYISLDLETTGLDPERDQIIEIGAIKFQGEEILDTFNTLVDPQCHLPYRVYLLTGITSEELQTAPPFTVVSAELISFVGSHPIIGQNIINPIVPLYQGLNLVGYNSTVPKSRENAMASIDGGYSIWAYDGQTKQWSGYSTYAQQFLNTLNELAPDMGFWILVGQYEEWILSP